MAKKNKSNKRKNAQKRAQRKASSRKHHNNRRVAQQQAAERARQRYARDLERVLNTLGDAMESLGDQGNQIMGGALQEAFPAIDWLGLLNDEHWHVGVGVNYLVAAPSQLSLAGRLPQIIAGALEEADERRPLVLHRALQAGEFGVWEVDSKTAVTRVGGRGDGRSVSVDHMLGEDLTGGVTVGFWFEVDGKRLFWGFGPFEHAPNKLVHWRPDAALSEREATLAYHRACLGALVAPTYLLEGGALVSDDGDEDVEADIDTWADDGGPDEEVVEAAIEVWLGELPSDEPHPSVVDNAWMLCLTELDEDATTDDALTLLRETRALLAAASEAGFSLSGMSLPLEIALGVGALGGDKAVEAALLALTDGRASGKVLSRVLNLVGLHVEGVELLADHVLAHPLQVNAGAVNQVYDGLALSAEELEPVRDGIAIGMVAELLLLTLPSLLGPTPADRVYQTALSLVRAFVPEKLAGMPLKRLDLSSLTARTLTKALGDDATLERLPDTRAALLALDGVGPKRADEIVDRLMELLSLYFTTGLGGEHTLMVIGDSEALDAVDEAVEAMLASGVISEEQLSRIEETGEVPPELVEAMTAMLGEIDLASLMEPEE